MTYAVRPLADLLAEHGLAGVSEQQFEHGGYSGAAITHLIRGDGARFVIKRMWIERDWIMRSTNDVACREAAFAGAAVDLGSAARTPNLGAARDGDQYALLMRDITDDLLPQTTITHRQMAHIIAAMAALHHTPMPAAPIPWCDLERRVMLLTPAGASIAASYGAPVARDLVEGWRLFDQHASPGARDVIHALFDDPSPLIRGLDVLPAALLHGDLKLDNIGIAPNSRVWLIDWAMTTIAPPAIELGWFLAINSRRLPVGLDEVMHRYAEVVSLPAEDRKRHDALTVLCGLLLRGWRKALDAEAGEPEELRWWCEHAERAAAFL